MPLDPYGSMPGRAKFSPQEEEQIKKQYGLPRGATAITVVKTLEGARLEYVVIPEEMRIRPTVKERVAEVQEKLAATYASLARTHQKLVESSQRPRGFPGDVFFRTLFEELHPIGEPFYYGAKSIVETYERGRKHEELIKPTPFKYEGPPISERLIETWEAVEEFAFGGGVMRETWKRMGIKEEDREQLEKATMPFLRQVTEAAPLKTVREFAYVPIGIVRDVESYGRSDVSYIDIPKFEEHPGLFMGQVTSDILVGKYIMGPVLGEAWKGAKWVGKEVKSIIPEFIKEPIGYQAKFGWPAKVAHEAKLWRIEHLPSWRGSSLDVWLAKKFPEYYKATGGIAPGEVVIPDIAKGALSYPKLQASYLAWEMTHAPRTGGVWLGKYLIEESKKKLIPHLISRAGLTTVGYLQELGFERGLTPLVSQTQLTRMGIFPYIPKETATIAKSGITEFVMGLGVSTLLRIPREPSLKEENRLVWQPTLAQERQKYDPLEVHKLEPKERKKTIPIPHIIPVHIPDIVHVSSTAPFQEVAQGQTLQQIQMQEQKQMQMAKQMLQTETKHSPLLASPRFEFGEPKKRRRRKKVYDPLKESRWLWKYPIATPKEFMKTVLG